MVVSNLLCKHNQHRKICYSSFSSESESSINATPGIGREDAVEDEERRGGGTTNDSRDLTTPEFACNDKVRGRLGIPAIARILT
jgi:hypothetical protein